PREQLSRNAYERLATAVLVSSGRFADEADVDIDGPGAEDRLRPGSGQLRTTGAACNALVQLPQLNQPIFARGRAPFRPRRPARPGLVCVLFSQCVPHPPTAGTAPRYRGGPNPPPPQNGFPAAVGPDG